MMDAKKKAKFVKPLYWKDTKASGFVNILAFGFVGLSGLILMLDYELRERYPKRIFDDTPLAKFFESDQFILHQAISRNKLPLDSRTGKYEREIETTDRFSGSNF